MTVTPEELAGRVADVRGGTDQASTVIDIVTSMAKAHTRGNGFSDAGEPNSDIAAVIVTASVRLLAHPDQLPMSQNMGAMSVEYPKGGFQGWNLIERSVLDRYRVKAK